MRASREQVRAWSLSAVADDYENLTLILHEVGKFAKAAEVEVSIADLLEALGVLVRDGFVQTYILGRNSRKIDTALPIPDDVSGEDWVYFYITTDGAKVLAQMSQTLFPDRSHL